MIMKKIPILTDMKQFQISIRHALILLIVSFFIGVLGSVLKIFQLPLHNAILWVSIITLVLGLTGTIYFVLTKGKNF